PDTHFDIQLSDTLTGGKLAVFNDRRRSEPDYIDFICVWDSKRKGVRESAIHLAEFPPEFRPIIAARLFRGQVLFNQAHDWVVNSASMMTDRSFQLAFDLEAAL